MSLKTDSIVNVIRGGRWVKVVEDDRLRLVFHGLLFVYANNSILFCLTLRLKEKWITSFKEGCFLFIVNLSMVDFACVYSTVLLWLKAENVLNPGCNWKSLILTKV